MVMTSAAQATTTTSTHNRLLMAAIANPNPELSTSGIGSGTLQATSKNVSASSSEQRNNTKISETGLVTNIITPVTATTMLPPQPVIDKETAIAKIKVSGKNCGKILFEKLLVLKKRGHKFACVYPVKFLLTPYSNINFLYVALQMLKDHF